MWFILTTNTLRTKRFWYEDSNLWFSKYTEGKTHVERVNNTNERQRSSELSISPTSHFHTRSTETHWSQQPVTDKLPISIIVHDAWYPKGNRRIPKCFLMWSLWMCYNNAVCTGGSPITDQLPEFKNQCSRLLVHSTGQPIKMVDPTSSKMQFNSVFHFSVINKHLCLLNSKPPVCSAGFLLYIWGLQAPAEIL